MARQRQLALSRLDLDDPEVLEAFRRGLEMCAKLESPGRSSRTTGVTLKKLSAWTPDREASRQTREDLNRRLAPVMAEIAAVPERSRARFENTPIHRLLGRDRLLLRRA